MKRPKDLDPKTLRFLADGYIGRAEWSEGIADSLIRRRTTPLSSTLESERFRALLRVHHRDARGWRNEAKRLRNLATRAERGI